MQSLLLKLSPESALALPLAASLVFNALLLLALLHRCSSKAPRATKPAAAQALSPKPAQRPKKQTRQPPDVSDPVAAVEKLRALNADFKYLEAGELLDALQLALSGDGHGSSATWSIGAQWSKDEARQQLNELLNSSSLEERISTARAAVKDLNNDQGFDLIQEDPTMKVLQRLTPDRVLTVKIEAVLEGVSPAQCIMIWREAALYPEWFPFVTGGKTLGDIHPGDTIVHILVETFFMSVDMVLWGWACDNLSEGELLMCVRPVRSSTKRPPGVPYRHRRRRAPTDCLRRAPRPCRHRYPRRAARRPVGALRLPDVRPAALVHAVVGDQLCGAECDGRHLPQDERGGDPDGEG